MDRKGLEKVYGIVPTSGYWRTQRARCFECGSVHRLRLWVRPYYRALPGDQPL